MNIGYDFQHAGIALSSLETGGRGKKTRVEETPYSQNSSRSGLPPPSYRVTTPFLLFPFPSVRSCLTRVQKLRERAVGRSAELLLSHTPLGGRRHNFYAETEKGSRGGGWKATPGLAAAAAAPAAAAAAVVGECSVVVALRIRSLVHGRIRKAGKLPESSLATSAPFFLANDTDASQGKRGGGGKKALRHVVYYYGSKSRRGGGGGRRIFLQLTVLKLPPLKFLHKRPTVSTTLIATTVGNRRTVSVR